MHALYLKRSQTVCIICTVYEQPAINGRSVAAMTNKKVPYLLQLEAPVSATVDDAALWQ